MSVTNKIRYDASHSCHVSWMSFGWWTILDKHGKLLSVKTQKRCSSLLKPVLPGTYYHTSFKGT